MKTLTTYVWVVLTAFFIGSCERIDLNEYEDPETNNSGKESFYGNAQLEINTRGALELTDSENGTIEVTEKISYPVCIYIFDSETSKLADMRMIANKDEQVKLSLKKGTYKVYGVGLDQENLYNIPNMDEANPELPITLYSDNEHGDLMTASATISLADDEVNKLNLQMVRKTMRLESVTMEKIPDDVTAVTVTLVPLGESVKVDGTIDGTSGIKELDLEKTEGTQTWKYTKGVYLLASGKPATIKVALTYKSGKTLAYSYTSEETLDANYKMSINGEYVSNEVQVSGVLSGVGWAGTKTISFQMQGGSGKLESMPEAGQIYNGYYVLNSVKSGEHVILTLMSTEEKIGLVYNDNDNQASMNTAVNNALKELSKNGIAMRVPTKEEREFLRTHITEVNNNLGEAGLTKLTVNAKDDRKDAYFTRSQKTGKLTVFFLSDGNVVIADAGLLFSKSAGFRLRGFATVII